MGRECSAFRRKVRKGGDEEARQWAISSIKDGYVAASSRIPKKEGRKVT